LGQPRKSGQTYPKKPKKKGVGLGNWVSMVSKNEKPIKINGFRVKNQTQTQKTHLPNNVSIFYLIW